MFGKAIKFILVIVFSIALVTVGVDAADHYGDFSNSIIGRLVGGGQDGPCPEGMAFVPDDKDGFCVDVYENSAGDKCPYLDPANERESSLNLSNPECLPASRAGFIPWRNLTQIQAVNLCAKAGKRLPTAEEWFAAALGTPDKEQGWSGDDCQVAGNWKKQPGLAGTGKNCVSYIGAYDMIGNVWEWVKGEAVDGVYNNLKMPEDGYVKSVNTGGVPLETDFEKPNASLNSDYFWVKNKGARGLARGGYWDNKKEAGQYSLYAVTDPSFSGVGVGLRCVKAPDKK